MRDVHPNSSVKVGLFTPTGETDAMVYVEIGGECALLSRADTVNLTKALNAAAEHLPPDPGESIH